VFHWLAATGGVAEPEMLRTFNCGIGMVAVLDPAGADAAIKAWTDAGQSVAQLGSVITLKPGMPDVSFVGRLASPGDAMARKRVAVLISGRGSNMASLIEAARAPTIRPRSRLSSPIGLMRLARARAQSQCANPGGRSSAAWKGSGGFERVLQHALDEHRIELICLGGFMRLFTADFVLHWQGRMLNIHPSLLPSFPGLDPHGQALRAGVRISGATVHFVIPETDAGPIIAQAAVAVREGDTVDTLAARVLHGRASHLSAGAQACCARTRPDRGRSLPCRGGAASDAF